MKRYYFDHAAATPLDPAVEKAMKPYWREIAGNPGSLHWFGQQASAAVFSARETIAKSLGCGYGEIIFTGSATEANNLALRGVMKSVLNDRNVLGVVNDKTTDRTIRTAGTDRTMIAGKPKIIVSAIEHDSILDTCKDLEKEGVEVVYLPVSKAGIVDPASVAKALDERTVLVSIMYANNEIGTIQPISEIAKIVSDFRKESRIRNKELGKNPNPIIHNSLFDLPLLHTDAVQAFNYLSCNVEELGVDL
ncbi:MAG: aminotransferase class V-fold PLP-dependent enzyme, partial [Patescibacteria group bacterium]|nr:aminotransferase class V-fold PLP-dependent enzyme [Patescibacteria group bacterium]